MNSNVMNYAAVIASNSFYVGGNWGFVLKDNEEYNQILTILRQDKNVKYLTVSNGLIVFCDMGYLTQTISQVESVTPEIVEKQKSRASIEIVEFQKFLTQIVHSSSKYGIVEDGYTEYNIGLYSCNNLHKIRLNGVEYPAFSLSIVEACKEILKISNVMDVYINAEGKFVNIKKLQEGLKIQNIVSNLEISNTLTGAFLTIRTVSR